MICKINTILKWELGEEEIYERILWVGEYNLYVIDIQSNKFPYLRSILEIEAGFKSGEVVYSNNDPYKPITIEENIPDKYKMHRNKAWNLIRDIVVEEPQIYQSSTRKEMIREVAARSGRGETTIIGYLKRFWVRGKVPNALLPDYKNCGARGKERIAGTSKRGRPRKYEDITGAGINIMEDIKRIFRTSLNKFYFNNSKRSLTTAYDLMRKEYFIDGYKEENNIKVPILKSQGDIPTFGQFKYWFEKERNIKKEVTSRYSNKRFQKEFRSITGNVLDGIVCPGEYEIDCQIGDIYLVSRYDRNAIIGRPAIYIVIDKFSRAICGAYVGLEMGSYMGAAMALMNALTDKVKFCREYGIKIKEEEWPMCQIPNTIIADRGELHGKSIENLINMLNISVQNTPPYRADLKPLVEGFFGFLNGKTKPFLPGTINLDGRERGDKDYRLNARLDLYQFTKIVIKCILFHNNNYHLDSYKRDYDMLEDNVICIPNNIWNWGIENRGGTLRSVEEDVAKLALMPTDIGVITAKGIRFKDMYYANTRILKGEKFIIARRSGSSRVKISYDPRNINYIYVWDEKFETFDKHTLLEGSNRYRDRYLEEIEILLEQEKRRILKNSDGEAQANAKLITEIECIVEEAKVLYKEGENNLASNKKKLENIRDNRRIEKTIRRKEEFFELESFGNKDEGQLDMKNKDDDNTLDLLFKKQKEKFSNG